MGYATGSRFAWLAGFLTAVVSFGIGTARADDKSGAPGAVYTLTNESVGNRLAVFARDSDGMLAPPHLVSTGGLGTGGGLGNQSSLAFSEQGQYLYAVNPGSNTITVFDLSGRRPRVAQVGHSGGQRPISLVVNKNRLYVLNAGGAVGGVDTVATFVAGPRGRFLPVPIVVRELSAPNTGPAQVGLGKHGEALIVTEKATNLIAIFPIDRRGLPGPPSFEASSGETPFGFAFDGDDLLIVSEAFGGAPDASAVSSYEVKRDNTLDLISPSVPTTETAACWIAILQGGKYAYTTNTQSNSITGYAVDDGELTRLDQDGVTAFSGGMSPTDLAIIGKRFLYALNSGSRDLGVFEINRDGSLTYLQVIGQLPTGTPTGLMAR